MPHTAMFHRLGTVDGADVYLERHSRSLLRLRAEASHCLAHDGDRNVAVSDVAWRYLCESRLSVSPSNPGETGHPRQPPGIELTVVTTDRCNFACPYCFAHTLYRSSTTLDAESIARHVRRFLELSQTRLSSLIFFGGEPLLTFQAMKRAWKELGALFARHQGGLPSLAIVTNGSLITGDIARFLADNDVFVTVSLDGPRAVHDACRPLQGGRASYDKVVAGIDELAGAGVSYAIEATYTSRHLQLGIDVLNVVDHALGLGPAEVHVMPAFPEQASGIDTSDNARVAGLFQAAAARAARRYLNSGAEELAYASRLAYAFAHDRRRRYICTAGLDKFTVMTNGDVVPCYLVCDAAHRMASFSEPEESDTRASLLERAASTYRVLAREHLPACLACWASDWCFACYGPAYARETRLGAPGGLECEVYRAMVEATLLECARFLIEKTHKTPAVVSRRGT